MTSLYIHIPFCKQKCFYCSFVVSIGQEQKTKQYLECLSREAEQYSKPKVFSIYIGGGTPTLMKEQQIEQLFELIRNNFQVQDCAEWTIEANPEDCKIEKLTIIKNYGVNRISLGVQSLNNHYLKYLGRNHDAQRAKKAYQEIRNAGFDNVSVDLMFSFPEQTDDELKNDISQIAELESDHLSLYALSIEEPSKFYKQNIKLNNEHIQGRQYELVCSELERYGFHQYEVSNFAKKDKRSIHNMHYWQGGEYIGLGIGAHSHQGLRRSWNITQLNQYMDNVLKGASVKQGEEMLTPYNKMKEVFLFGLRMNQGVDLKKIQKQYGLNLGEEERLKVRKFIEGGLLVNNRGILCASSRGRLVLDELCAQLI